MISAFIQIVPPVKVIPSEVYYLVLEDSTGTQYFFHKKHKADGRKFRQGEYDGWENKLVIQKPWWKRVWSWITNQPMTFKELATAHSVWTWSQFPAATPLSSLQKCRKEIQEIEDCLRAGGPDAIEYVDAIMCLLDSASRAGINYQTIEHAFAYKLAMNMEREWVDNGDGTYSHKKTEA